jgi:hypothetical protein
MRIVQGVLRSGQIGNKKMDLLKQVTLSPLAKGDSSRGTRIYRSMKLSLFEAVRSWTDEEGNPFDIEVDGNPLTKEQIQEIAHSEAYKEELLAFDERR